jgi:protein gp37
VSTAIQWTDETWNPVVGCTQVSPGCAHCYAKSLHDMRHKASLGGKAMAVQYAQPFEVVQLKPERLPHPLSWRRPRRIFVNSVSDLFHEAVPDSYIDEVMAVVALSAALGRGHVFQVLTKRAERMRAYFTSEVSAGRWADRLGHAEENALGGDGSNRAHVGNSITGMLGAGRNCDWPMTNLWLGVSVENQRFADERIPLLMETPAAVRFLSCEPLLARVKIDFEDIATRAWDGRRVDWVIIGGESGKDARRFELRWAESLIEQCRAAGVAVFMKQIGALATMGGDCFPYLTGGHGDDMDRWPNDLRVREFPALAGAR